jgi:general secretion pathway protein D
LFPHRFALSLAACAAILAAGCASPGLKEGRALIDAGQPEAGIARLRAGLAEEPGNLELKSYYHTQRERLAAGWLTRAQQDFDAGRFDAAEAMLLRVQAVHPENPRAAALLAGLADARANARTIEAAARDLATGHPEQAEQAAREVLARAPEHAGAQAVLREIQTARAADEAAPRTLGAAYRKPITLELRDAPLKNAFDMIARQSGLNFVFDKDVRLDSKVTLYARGTPIVDAVDMILLTGQLAKKVVNASTLLIYPDQPQKQKLYQELMVKSFYLGNADAKSTLALLRSVVKTRDIHVDERLNLLVMRDTPEAIRLAEKVVAVQDLAEPEVMLEVEVLEIKRGRLLDLGVQYPNQFSLLNTLTTDTASTTGGVIVNTTTTTLSPLPLTVDKLRDIAGRDIAMNGPQLNARKEDSDVNLLANPRIRVKNREKAKIHIGDKVPVITSNATATGVVSESVSYLDVGLKLDVEPNVLMRDDVQIRVGLEVSNIVREIRSNSGTLTYQIGTRNAGTTLRLKDGETQVLAGLISDEDRSAASRVPGLGDLPLIGRLFSSQRDERSKTEIVLLITPRVLRGIQTGRPALTEFRSGTDSAVGGGLSLPMATALPNAPGQPEARADAPLAPEVDPPVVPPFPVPLLPPPPGQPIVPAE